MKKLNIKTLALTSLCLSVMTLASCANNTQAHEKFGYDTEYFIGLKLVSEGDLKSAATKLKKCAKKGSYYCARRSYETLCGIGNVQENINNAKKLHEQYHDSDSLLLLLKLLDENNEVHSIIEYTNDIDFKTEYNEIIKIRLQALKKRGDSRYESEVYKWFSEKPISSFHYKFYRDFYDHPDFPDDFRMNIENEKNFFTPQQFVINYRIENYNRNYLYTYNNSDQLFTYFSSNILPFTVELASDIGKAYLYGSGDYTQNASFFMEKANEYKGTPLEFYFKFYAGRLFNKADLSYTHAKNCFEGAMECAVTPAQRDNALWYLLDTSLDYSINSIINSIGKYARMWHDPEYFDDFFDSLLPSLLAGGRWTQIGDIYKAIDGYASDDIVARYAYTYARLIEEGKANGNEEDIKKAFIRACNSGYSTYYKALASYHLGLNESELTKVLCMPYGKEQKERDIAVETLLSGYAYFGFPQLIYDEWDSLYENGISAETSLYIANFLNKCSNGNDEYYHQSLRIASRIMGENTEVLPKEYLKLVYPMNYKEIIENYSNAYGTIPSTIYALVRSESYFNPTVSSHAGAIGLAQLMESTGNDIARKLRKTEYNLLDPETNLQFGIYYLAELTRRSEDSILSAFFSYNAGITRVRRWKNNNIIGFGTKKDMPMDLFLETIPYTETREYGRKILGASVMYEWLYSTNPMESFNNIIEVLLK